MLLINALDVVIAGVCTKYVIVPQASYRMRSERRVVPLALMIQALNKRTIYSLSHTYATMRIVYSEIDIHTLAVNMGTSVPMIERHYSHLEPIMAAKRLARFDKEEYKLPARDGVSSSSEAVSERAGRITKPPD